MSSLETPILDAVEEVNEKVSKHLKTSLVRVSLPIPTIGEATIYRETVAGVLDRVSIGFRADASIAQSAYFNIYVDGVISLNTPGIFTSFMPSTDWASAVQYGVLKDYSTIGKLKFNLQKLSETPADFNYELSIHYTKSIEITLQLINAPQNIPANLIYDCVIEKRSYV